jgi:hypothetical protein
LLQWGRIYAEASAANIGSNSALFNSPILFYADIRSIVRIKVFEKIVCEQPASHIRFLMSAPTRRLGRLLEPLGAIAVGIGGGLWIFNGPIKEAVEEEKRKHATGQGTPSVTSGISAPVSDSTSQKK